MAVFLLSSVSMSVKLCLAENRDVLRRKYA